MEFHTNKYFGMDNFVCRICRADAEVNSSPNNLFDFYDESGSGNNAVITI